VGRPPKLLGLGRGVSGLLDPLGRGRRFVPRSSIWGRRTGPNGATATNCSRGRRGALEQAGGIGGFGGRDDDSGGYCAARTGGGPRTIGRGGRERRRGELKRVIISSRVRTVSLVSARVLYLRVSVLLSWRCPPTVSVTTGTRGAPGLPAESSPIRASGQLIVRRQEIDTVRA
jgi:hypothetical protein